MNVAGLLQQQLATREYLPSGLAFGGDISNHQTRDISGLLATYDWEYVVCRSQAPGEPDHFRSITVAQVEQLQHAGIARDLYDWGYRTAIPEQTAANTAALALGLGVHGIQHLDCETYEKDGVLIDPGPTDADWIWRWVREVESYRLTPCLYTGIWWIEKHFIGGQRAFAQFADRCLLWISDGRPHLYTFDSVPLPLGWDRARLLGWQWQLSPIDLDSWQRSLLHQHRRR